jgi:nucleoid-associated protein YgaU
MKFSAMIALMSLSLIACSGSKSAQKVNEDVAQIELTETDDLLLEDNDPLMADMMGGTLTEETPVISEVSEISTTQTYTVQKNETLMLIAFKLYGDYEQWKQLANLNKDVLTNGNNLREGMVLKYLAPVEQFVWNPEGQPYLIKTGDTLGFISNSVYQTSRKWKVLWDNNRPLIKDPNKIFAGFTIYYPDQNRDVASENL